MNFRPYRWPFDWPVIRGERSFGMCTGEKRRARYMVSLRQVCEEVFMGSPSGDLFFNACFEYTYRASGSLICRRGFRF